jgi:hypothetical protein
LISCCLAGKLIKRIHYDKEIYFIPITKEYIEIHRSKLNPIIPHFRLCIFFLTVYFLGFGIADGQTDKIHRKYIDKIQRKYLVEVGLRRPLGDL